uniref:Uncharacterized protein n=1 Tax=Arundo donax TaxID=35708 RepID=A0A0A9BS85_ARUDO
MGVLGKLPFYPAGCSSAELLGALLSYTVHSDDFQGFLPSPYPSAMETACAHSRW